jgi:hypothetical protein
VQPWGFILQFKNFQPVHLEFHRHIHNWLKAFSLLPKYVQILCSKKQALRVCSKLAKKRFCIITRCYRDHGQSKTGIGIHTNKPHF